MPTGTLVMQAYPGWPVGSNTRHDAIYYARHNAPTEVVTCLKNAARGINDVHSPYVAATGPNSNSGIATAIQYCGIPNVLPASAVGRDYYVSFAP